MNLPEEEQERRGPLVISMLLTAVGKSMESLIRAKTELNLTGFGHVWWEEERITGDVFLCVLVQMILKEKALMV